MIPCDVVAVHRADQDPVGRRVEPVDQLVALVVEVADHRRTPVGFDRAAEPLGEVGLAAVRGHRQLAGQRQALQAEMLELTVNPDKPARGAGLSRRHAAVDSGLPLDSLGSLWVTGQGGGEIGTRAFLLKPGGVFGPFALDTARLAVIKLLEVRPSESLPFASVADRARADATRMRATPAMCTTAPFVHGNSTINTRQDERGTAIRDGA